MALGWVVTGPLNSKQVLLGSGWVIYIALMCCSSLCDGLLVSTSQDPEFNVNGEYLHVLLRFWIRQLTLFVFGCSLFL